MFQHATSFLNEATSNKDSERYHYHLAKNIMKSSVIQHERFHISHKRRNKISSIACLRECALMAFKSHFNKPTLKVEQTLPMVIDTELKRRIVVVRSQHYELKI